MDMRGIANQKHDGPAEADEEPVCNGRTIPEAGGPNSGGDVYGLWIHRRVRGEEARTELIESVWKLWLTWDPLFMIDRHAEAFRGLRLLFLDCGKDDEFYLELGARAFVKKLRAMGIAHEYEEFEDGHMSISYRMDRSLPKLSHALAR